MNHLEENNEDGLLIFTPPPANTAIQSRPWIEYCLLNQIIEYATLDFVVLPQSAGYMDLRRSTLRVRFRLLDTTGSHMGKHTNVALVNLPLRTLFSQVDCSLQQTAVTQAGPNYPYKTSQLFEKDTAEHHDDADIRTGSNTGA